MMFSRGRKFLTGSRPYLAQFFQNEQFVHKIAFFHRRLSSHFNFLTFLTFVFHLILDPDPSPKAEPESVSLRRKVAVPAVPILFLVPHYWLKDK